MEIGSHQMVPLIMKEWQPGGKLKYMERIYFLRCMSILKVTTRNGQGKSRKRRIVSHRGRRTKREYKHPPMLHKF